jgi:hypothetical protein
MRGAINDPIHANVDQDKTMCLVSTIEAKSYTTDPELNKLASGYMLRISSMHKFCSAGRGWVRRRIDTCGKRRR